MFGEPAFDHLGQRAATPTLIQSLQRGMYLVEAVTRYGPLTARDLSDVTGIVLPTTYHLLRTLVHENYLRRSDDGRYALGGQLSSVSQLERRARSLRLCHEALTDLAAEARVSVSMGTLRGATMLITQFVAHSSVPRFECWPGMVIPAHATAIGKSLLSQMRPQQRAEYLVAQPLIGLTSQTITMESRLEKEIASAGVVRSDQEYLYGISCTATSLNATGALVALGAACPTSRSQRLRNRLDDVVTTTADRISAALLLLDTDQTSERSGQSPIVRAGRG